MKVLCAILTRDASIQDDVRDALLASMKHAETIGIQTEYTKCIERYGVAIGRNRIVATFLKGDWSHLLMIDDDVSVPVNAVADLVQCDADIAAGCCVFLREEKRRIIPTLNGKVDGEWCESWFDGPREADRVGTGCSMFKRDIFSRVGTPGAWFQWPTWLDDDGHFQSTSDDMDFCRRAKEAGCRLVFHGDVRCGHYRRIDLAALVPGRTKQTVGC